MIAVATSLAQVVLVLGINPGPGPHVTMLGLTPLAVIPDSSVTGTHICAPLLAPSGPCCS